MELRMHRELITDPLDREDLWSDLRDNLELLKTHGYTEVSAFFGFAWGKHIYEDQWYDMPISSAALEELVIEAEKKGWGRLGEDNLYFTVTQVPLRLNYSYECDIHLSYAEENEIVARIRQRWLTHEWLTEFLKSKSYDR